MDVEYLTTTHYPDVLILTETNHTTHKSRWRIALPTLLDNYRPIALMNNLLKLWTALIKDAGSKYAETHDTAAFMMLFPPSS
jgi:hypothetical protein